MMRIGFDAKRIFHNFRGIGNYSRTLVEGLQEFYPSNDYFLYSPPIKDPRGEAWKDKFSNFELRIPENGVGRMFPSIWRSLLLSDDLKKDNLDLYHGLTHELPPGIDKLKIKSIVTIHDLIYLRYPEFFPWIDRQVYDRKFRYSTEKADLVVAICEQTKRDLIEFFGTPEEKIRVVYQSCMPHFYEKIEAEKKEEVLKKSHITGDFILYVGALEERKNALSLVRAFRKIMKDCNEDLILIGQGKSYKEKIQNYILEHGLSNRVKILSDVSWQDLPVFYQSAKTFVFPSFFEGFGIPIIESLVSGTPVITSKGSCFPEAGGPGSKYIDPHNLEELSKTLREVLQSKNLQEEMIDVGKAYVRKFHCETTARALMDVYREIT